MDDRKLEDSLNSLIRKEEPKKVEMSREEPNESVHSSPMSTKEEIGFHKGALNTLVAERNELVKMAGTVEAIMQAHISALEKLGVKIRTN